VYNDPVCVSEKPTGGLAMDKCIMIGCDLHDENMLLKVAVDRAAPEQRSLPAGLVGG
jgi:hypothetical protein